MTDPKFILRFTNSHEEKFYFVANGPVHTSTALGAIHLISATTPDKSKARKFDTAPEAAQVLVDAGKPVDWEVVPV